MILNLLTKNENNTIWCINMTILKDINIKLLKLVDRLIRNFKFYENRIVLYFQNQNIWKDCHLYYEIIFTHLLTGSIHTHTHHITYHP